MRGIVFSIVVSYSGRKHFWFSGLRNGDGISTRGLTVGFFSHGQDPNRTSGPRAVHRCADALEADDLIARGTDVWPVQLKRNVLIGYRNPGEPRGVSGKHHMRRPPQAHSDR